MSQPVKLSDALVIDARLAGESFERSIAGQVEYWAKLGRAIESVLQVGEVLALCRSAEARPISVCLKEADSETGRKRVADYLKTLPYPHYEPAPGSPGLLLRIEADGRRTLGRFVNRQFVIAEPERAKP